MKGSIQLYIRVTHNVGAPDKQQELINDVLIDELYIEISNLTSFSPRTLAEFLWGMVVELKQSYSLK